jgi:hypothetical protein
MDVEWLILADYAQIIGNKLYAQGGGWDKLTVNSNFPVQQRVGLAASFVVPWDETNQRHAVVIEVQTDDGASVAKIESQLEVGRPAGHPPGQEQRAQLAGNLTLNLNAGTYAIVATIEGVERRRIRFNVVPGPMIAMQQQKQQKGPDAPGGGETPGS